MKGEGYKWDDPKFERKQRVHIAQNQTKYGHGIIEAMSVLMMAALVDVAHSFWSFVITMVALFLILMFCVWKWTQLQCQSVIDRLECASVSEQCEIYMTNNPTQKVSKSFQLHTNGVMNIKLCSRMPFAIQKAAHIAAEYESNNPNTTYGITLMLVALW